MQSRAHLPACATPLVGELETRRHGAQAGWVGKPRQALAPPCLHCAQALNQMALKQIAVLVTSAVVNTAPPGVGAKPLAPCWSHTAQFAARLKNTHQNSDLIATAPY